MRWSSLLCALLLPAAVQAANLGLPIGPLPIEAESAPLAAAEAQALQDASDALLEGDFATAERLAREVTAAAPEAAPAWYVLGLALANLGRLEDAAEALGRSAALYERNAEPLVVQGEILLALGRSDAAREAYAAAAERDPENWRAHEGLAALAEQAGELPTALRESELAAEAAPEGAATPALRLARLRLATGDFAGAQAALADLPAAEDAEDAVLELAGRAAAGAGDPEAATGYFERLAARDRLAGPVGLAALAASAGDLAAAEAHLREAQERFPDDPAVYAELGSLLGATQRYEEALGVFEEGLALAPGAAPLLKGASMAEMRLGRTDAALARARSLTEGATAGDLVWLATLEEMAGNSTAAREGYAAALARDSQNLVALNNLAVLLTEAEPARAVELAEAAAALAPGIASVQDTLGWAYFAAGDTGAAEKVFADLAAAQPESALVAYRLGRVHLAAGREAEGRSELRRALELDPALPQAEDARQRLGE